MMFSLFRRHIYKIWIKFDKDRGGVREMEGIF